MKKALSIALALTAALAAQAQASPVSRLEHQVGILSVALLAFLACSVFVLVLLARQMGNSGRQDVQEALRSLSARLDKLGARLNELGELTSRQPESPGQPHAGGNADTDRLAQRIDEMAAALNRLERKMPGKRDAVAYNAAVDAWIHINDHLSSLGKNRWKIQHVYRLLAGEQVEAQQLRNDLEALDDEHREEVLTIVHDIERFMATHLSAVNEWLAGEGGDVKTFADAVRQPIGKPFDAALDEEVMGDDVAAGTIVERVAQLGYYFPGSRNGGYRKKAVIVA